MIPTDELRELLAKVTPGEWLIKDAYRGGFLVMCEKHEPGCVRQRRLDYPSGEFDEADARLIALAPFLATEVLRLRELEEWKPIESAPTNTPVEVRLGVGMTITASLESDAAMSDEGNSCDQWQAVHEGEHPECWHDGCCWESNASGNPSMQPTGWRPLTQADERESE